MQPVSGKLTDHYDPRTKVVKLSDSVYNATSVAAIGVAAHECGHAMQHNEGYGPLRFRSALVPVANFGSQLSWPMILLGILFGGLGSPLVQVGILMFSLAVLFQLVTLPVKGSGPYVRGGGGRLYFTASASCDPVWRKRP